MLELAFCSHHEQLLLLLLSQLCTCFIMERLWMRNALGYILRFTPFMVALLALRSYISNCIFGRRSYFLVSLISFYIFSLLASHFSWFRILVWAFRSSKRWISVSIEIRRFRGDLSPVVFLNPCYFFLNELIILFLEPNKFKIPLRRNSITILSLLSDRNLVRVLNRSWVKHDLLGVCCACTSSWACRRNLLHFLAMVSGVAFE